MTTTMKRVGSSSFAFLLAILCLLLISMTAAHPAKATHSWGSYHWARTANPFALALGDNVTTVYDNNLAVASSDWTQSTMLDTAVVPGGVDPVACPAVSGMVEVCNAFYGKTGWLGLATIWPDAQGHIYAGRTQLNDTYMQATGGRLKKYNKNSWRQFVTCQEIGHTFGLAHQDENFSNTNVGSCMDYTNKPAGGGSYGPSNLHPNQGDYDQLRCTYDPATFGVTLSTATHTCTGSGHLDSYTTAGSSRAVPQFNATSPSERGQLIYSSPAMKVYERHFDNGRSAITFVDLV